MATIEDLQQLEFNKIKSIPLKTAVENIVKDYEDDEDQDNFKKVAKDNINNLYAMVKAHASDAIKEKQTEKPKAEKKSKSPKISVKDELEKMLGALERIEDNQEENEFKGLLKTTRLVLYNSLYIQNEKELQASIIETTNVYKRQIKEIEKKTEDHPNESELKGRKLALETINQLLSQLNPTTKKEESKKQAEPTEKEKKSKAVVAKAEKALDELALCRLKIREDRQKKIESGEIKKPKKKRLTTKLKDALKKVVNMMPEKVKQDKKKVEKTELALDNFLSELKSIWGLNKICAIREELEEKFDEIKEKAA